jgi:predicted GTPase
MTDPGPDDRFETLIMGAAGRDFHDLQTFFASHPRFRVRAITATQIPYIDDRAFPHELIGSDLYPEDIPIVGAEQLEALIDRWDIEFVFLAYSDLPHAEVMHQACRVQAAGASFGLLGPRHTQLISDKPVIAVTAVRTGAGKSPLSQAIANHLRASDRRAGVLRHPMPYGDLRKQAVQKFVTPEDLTRHACTIEEREEYEPYVEQGLTIYAGVRYRDILTAAEADNDVILWDGGNNDTPFVEPDLWIVVADALRPGHEVGYYPGETNFRAADVIIINKVAQAAPEAVAAIRERAARLNPDAVVIEADLTITVDDPSLVSGRRALVIEDGPTLTHGGMAFGAGVLAAQRYEARELIDPRPFAVGSIAKAYRDYPHLGALLPALGYSEEQRAELAETIRRAAPEVIIDGSPARVSRLLDLDIPTVLVNYAYEQRAGEPIMAQIDRAIAMAG